MRKILVVREFDNFSRVLANSGFTVINLPLVETKPILDLSEFEARLDAIKDYDGIFLTSAAATKVFRTKLIERNISFHGRIYVLGKRSFELLKSENLGLFFDENINTARELLEKIAPEDLKDKRFLFLCGDNSLRTVPDFLSGTAAVDTAIVYETQAVIIETDKLNSLLKEIETSEIVCACFFSPSAAKVFIEQFGTTILHQTKIATIGKTTAEFLEARSIKVRFVASKATAEDFATELIKYLETNDRVFSRVNTG